MNICPKCQHELLVVQYEGIELLKCAHCQGFWFREGKFREVKQLGFRKLAEITAEMNSETTATDTYSSEGE